MALDNFANLKASIEDWSHRNDVKDRIDDFIQMCEAEMYFNSDANLRVRSMEKTAEVSTVITEGFIDLPTDFLENRRLDILFDSGELVTLEYKTPEQMHIDLTVSGTPRFFTITDQILFDKLPDKVYTIKFYYFASLPALSAANSTNDILTKTPHIYLYGSLMALNQFANDTEEEQKNFQRFIRSIRGANATDRKGRYGPAPKQRLRSATP